MKVKNVTNVNLLSKKRTKGSEENVKSGNRKGLKEEKKEEYRDFII